MESTQTCALNERVYPLLSVLFISDCKVPGPSGGANRESKTTRPLLFGHFVRSLNGTLLQIEQVDAALHLLQVGTLIIFNPFVRPQNDISLLETAE